jgi:hypothetical protein
MIVRALGLLARLASGFPVHAGRRRGVGERLCRYQDRAVPLNASSRLMPEPRGVQSCRPVRRALRQAHWEQLYRLLAHQDI